MKQYESLVKTNINSMAIIMDNPVTRLLLDSVSSLHPFIVPTQVVNDNKAALDYVINEFK